MGADDNFWSVAAPGFNEPKRGYRWLCQINDIPQWICKTVTKPRFSISETSHRFINHTFYYPGRVEWNTCDVTLADPGNPDMVMTILNMIESAGYSVPTSATNKWNTLSKGSSIESVSGVTISQIDRNGMPTEVWTLKNPWIKDVNFGDLSYDSDELMNISLTFRYDWAKCELTPSAGDPLKQGGVKQKNEFGFD